MSTQMKRFMLSITPEMDKEMRLLKKERFYDVPYAEMYRAVIKLGLEEAERQKQQTENRDL